jgi:hypothetical protein
LARFIAFKGGLQAALFVWRATSPRQVPGPIRQALAARAPQMDASRAA